jgi:hypothetical protein
MKRVPSKPPAAKVRQWRASIIRHRMELLGRVAATDRDGAEAAAVEEFRLNEWQRKSLVISPAHRPLPERMLETD